TEALQEADHVLHIPGQPLVNFQQYSGYVTADENYGKALFYWFFEATYKPSEKPVLLWLNGGPGCSSIGFGQAQELGPFLVKKDSVVKFNNYTWNKASNLLFLDAPAGVGFSYSNKTLDVYGDNITATDSYAFLVNWFKRFLQYKSNEFYIAGESYAGHYVLSLLRLSMMEPENNYKGELHKSQRFHACILLLAPKEIHSENRLRWKFKYFLGRILQDIMRKIPAGYDPCSQNHATDYFNRQDVQEALHANVTKISKAWELCDIDINVKWNDSSFSILPIIKKLTDGGLRVWMFSGDTDGRVPVTSTRYSLKKLGLNITEDWSPWYNHREVGGGLQFMKG
ncbi:hypothetical protein GIB67_036038, partial [Kingdonia uniflora]